MSAVHGLSRNTLKVVVLMLAALSISVNYSYAKGLPSGTSTSSWALGINLSDPGNSCLAAFEAQTGITSANGNLPVYYSSQAAAVADATAAFPQVYLDHVDPAVPTQGLPVFYVYGIPNCPGQSAFGPVIFSFSVYFDSTSTNKPPVGPNGTPCPANPTLSFGYPGVPQPASYMIAQFTPPDSNTVDTYAHSCGFDYIDWQQQLTTLPAKNVFPNSPSSISPANLCTTQNGCAANDGSLVASPTSPLYDPPPGGYTYYPGGNSYPFYYYLSSLGGFCTLAEATCPPFPLILSSDGKTLSFLDAPANDLPGIEASMTPPAGTFVAFQTSLVGVSSQTSQGSLACGSNSQYQCTPLFTWTWNSTFNGEACNGILSALGLCTTGGVSQTASYFQIVPGSGTGGATVMTINGGPPPPTFSLAAGTYTSVQMVSISDVTPGTVIYYTIDGTQPTTLSQTYAGPIPLISTETIEAIAVGPDSSQSSIATALYNINLPAAPTQITLLSTPGTGVQGTVFDLQATVTANGLPVSGGTVSFFDGTAPLDTVQVNSSTGIATLHTASLNPGSNSIQARFSQDKLDLTSSSNVVSVLVSGTFPTTTTLASSGGQGDYTLTATVTSSGVGTPSGSVKFNDITTGIALGSAAPVSLATLYTPAASIGTPTAPNDVAVGDVNGDGFLDIVTVGYNGSNNWITVALGNGDGTFGAPQVVTTTASNGGASVTLADVNGDGNLDILAGSYGGVGVAVFLGVGNGTFGSEVDYQVDSNYAASIITADVNGDGKLDIITSDNFGNSMSVLLGNGNGTFKAEHALPTDTSPESVAVADFDKDGQLDVVVANTTGTVSVYMGNGDGTFKPQALITADSNGEYLGPRGVATGDFNSDGKQDIVVGDWIQGSIVILFGNGDGTFQAPRQYSAPGANPNGIAVADLNRDGKPDIVVSSYNGSVATVLLSNGDGTFVTGSYTVGDSGSSLALGDFNGDGIIDIVTLDANDSLGSILLGRTSFTAVVNGINLEGVTTDSVSATYSGDSRFHSSFSNTLSLRSNASAAATPTFSIASGSYSSAQLVKIACATMGSTIYYTVNGTTPTVSSTPYTAPITVSTTETLKAIAFASGYGQSAVASASYTIQNGGGIPATLISPTAGTTLSTSATFIWNAGSGVTAYQLWVGTTANANNIYNSHGTLSLSETVTSIPANGGTIFVTLFSQLNGVYKSNAYTFIASGTPAKAVLTTPAPGAKLKGASATFAWTAGTGVTAYQLWLGSKPGINDIFNSGGTANVSVTATNLPTNGSTIFATLFSLIDGAYQNNMYSYVASGTPAPAVITGPTPGSTLSGTSATFSWTAGTGVSNYQLWLGTTASASNLYDSRGTYSESVTVTGLPTNGGTIFATLFSLIDGTYQSNSYTYIASGTPAAAVLTTPTPGTTLSGSSVTFDWTSGTGVTAYQFWLGTTPGASDIYNSHGTAALSATVAGLPTNGAKIYATLYSLIDGSYKSNAYTFTASH